MGWVSLEFTLLHRWFDGFETNFYVGFSIKNKMADLNTCTYLGFSIKNKIQKSGGLVVVCGWGCFGKKKWIV